MCDILLENLWFFANQRYIYAIFMPATYVQVLYTLPRMVFARYTLSTRVICVGDKF